MFLLLGICLLAQPSQASTNTNLEGWMDDSVDMLFYDPCLHVDCSPRRCPTPQLEWSPAQRRQNLPMATNRALSRGDSLGRSN